MEEEHKDRCTSCRRVVDLSGDEHVNAVWWNPAPIGAWYLEWVLCGSCSEEAETVPLDRLMMVLQALEGEDGEASRCEGSSDPG